MKQTENTKRLGEENIKTLLWEFSAPAIVATSASALYNVIDRIFIGHGVGPLAISGLALTFPLMNLGAAFGALIGVGSATLVSIRLGQKKEDEACLILNHTLMLNVITALIYSVATLFFLDDILTLLGASPQTLPYAKEFMYVILLGNIFTHVYLGLNNVMRASGNPKRAMSLTLQTILINIILAPLFIFVFKWGIKGAALSTVIAQVYGTGVLLNYFRKQGHIVHFIKSKFQLHFNIISEIISIGMSNFFMLTAATAVVAIMNWSLKEYGGDYAIGAFGIINSLLGVFAMMAIGFTQGMQPIAGYNFGANRMDRVLDVFKRTVFCASLVTLTGFIVCEFFPLPVIRLFTSNSELIDLTQTGMRIGFIMFPLVGFQMVTSNFFQSIKKAKISVTMSLSRQVIFLIPSLLLLPPLFGLKGVWGAMALSDLSAAILTIVLLKMNLPKAERETSKSLEN